jgi:hypothetical protein
MTLRGYHGRNFRCFRRVKYVEFLAAVRFSNWGFSRFGGKRHG